jgi:NADH-quinone oxidoreductase subunit A
MDPITPGSYIPTEYLPVLILMVIAFVFGAGALLVGEIFRLRRPYLEKLLPYESGNPPVGEPRYRFSIKFYIIAMLFVVFAVELVFIYPWALVYPGMGPVPFIGMMIFIAVLIIGYIYDWKKGAFKWD